MISFDTAGFDELADYLRRTFPLQADKAIRLALADAGRKAKSEGNKVARSEYTMRARDRKKVASKVRTKKHQTIVSFEGDKGTPLRAFTAKPRRPSGGRMPKRRPSDGVSVQVRRGGAFRPARGPHGQKTFWFRSPQGNVLLGYRPGNGRRISTEGLVAASPIQAIAKRANAERIADAAGGYAAGRLRHQLERILNGEKL